MGEDHHLGLLSFSLHLQINDYDRLYTLLIPEGETVRGSIKTMHAPGDTNTSNYFHPLLCLLCSLKDMERIMNCAINTYSGPQRTSPYSYTEPFHIKNSLLISLPKCLPGLKSMAESGNSTITLTLDFRSQGDKHAPTPLYEAQLDHTGISDLNAQIKERGSDGEL